MKQTTKKTVVQKQNSDNSLNIGPDERVRATVLFSLIAHAILILGVTFTYEDPAASLPSLDVILVPVNTAEKPKQADFLANATVQGGGDQEKTSRPSQPTTSLTPKNTPGVAPVPLMQKAQPPELKTKSPVLSSVNGAHMTHQQTQKESPPTPETIGHALLDVNLEMAQLAAAIEQHKELYAKRPKRKFVSASTQEYLYAAYMREWVARIERVGNLNYPDEARRASLAGQLVMTVAVRNNGSVESIDIIQSSGHHLLDEAAQRIVKLGEPFASLPEDDKDQVDVLHITRTWQFLPDGKLDTY